MPESGRLPVSQPNLSSGAIDLADVKARADARDKALAEVAERQRTDELTRRAAIWDRKMRRAFKGIFPTPLRHSFLQRSINAEDQ